MQPFLKLLTEGGTLANADFIKISFNRNPFEKGQLAENQFLDRDKNQFKIYMSRIEFIAAQQRQQIATAIYHLTYDS